MQSVKHERDAWRSLAGCEAPPADPYSDLYFERLMSSLPPAAPRSWEAVVVAFEATLSNPTSDSSCASGLILVSIFRGRVTAAVCEQATLGTLAQYRAFRYVLALALAGLSSDGRRPPDASFVLDLGDRSDLRLRGDVPKLAATTGGCAASLPVPIALKGFNDNLWLEVLRKPHLGGGSLWRWPQVAWSKKRRRAVWRGAFRSYSDCLRPTTTRSWAAEGAESATGSCGLRACSNYCYSHSSRSENSSARATSSSTFASRDTASHAASLALEMARTECPRCSCPGGLPPHPRAIAVRLSSAASAASTSPTTAAATATASGPLTAVGRQPRRRVGLLDAAFSPTATRGHDDRMMILDAVFSPCGEPRKPRRAVRHADCTEAALRARGLALGRSIPFEQARATVVLVGAHPAVAACCAQLAPLSRNLTKRWPSHQLTPLLHPTHIADTLPAQAAGHAISSHRCYATCSHLPHSFTSLLTPQLANFSAVLELDGYGWQASL